VSELSLTPASAPGSGIRSRHRAGVRTQLVRGGAPRGPGRVRTLMAVQPRHGAPCRATVARGAGSSRFRPPVRVATLVTPPLHSSGAQQPACTCDEAIARLSWDGRRQDGFAYRVPTSRPRSRRTTCQKAQRCSSWRWLGSFGDGPGDPAFQPGHALIAGRQSGNGHFRDARFRDGQEQLRGHVISRCVTGDGSGHERAGPLLWVGWAGPRSRCRGAFAGGSVPPTRSLASLLVGAPGRCRGRATDAEPAVECSTVGCIMAG
jgi:hypothetical protein